MLQEAFKLRDYQKNCVDSLINDLDDGYTRLGAVLPTGSGKTEIFISLCERYIKKNPDRCVLILSHLSLLTSQTKERFLLRSAMLNVDILQADKYPNFSADVVISTMQSARDSDKVAKAFKKNARKIGMIIVDECHYLQTDSYDKIIEPRKDAVVVGFTATPFRSSKLMTNYFEKVSYTISLAELIEKKYLVRPELYSAAIGDDLDDKIASIVKVYRECEMDKKTIIYMRTIEEAKIMCTAFLEQGIEASAITHDMPVKLRDTILDYYRNDKLNVLTTVNVLTAGFDARNIESIFMPYKVGSPTLYMQRVGRGLRPYPGKTSCRVYAFADAPSIQKGLYEKLNKIVLNKGRSIEDCVTIQDEMDYYEIFGASDDNEHYEWTRFLCEVAARFKLLGCINISNIISQKSFPHKFLTDMPGLIEAMPKRRVDPTRARATPTQMGLLRQYKIPVDPRMISKDEASLLIEVVLKARPKQDEEDDYWIIKTGRYQGRHVSDLFDKRYCYYRKYLQKNYPHNRITKQINEWDKLNKKFGREHVDYIEARRFEE